jgi:hypothetical protein
MRWVRVELTKWKKSRMEVVDRLDRDIIGVIRRVVTLIDN